MGAYLVPHVFFEEANPAKWIAIGAILLMVLLVARWPRIVRSFERRSKRP